MMDVDPANRAGSYATRIMSEYATNRGVEGRDELYSPMIFEIISGASLR